MRRVPAKLDVAYEDQSRQVFLGAADLSEEGVLIEDLNPPQEGSLAQLVIALPDSRLLRLRGVVTRVQEEPSAFAFRFDRNEMDDSDRDALRHFVERVPAAKDTL
jgi:hypothetical protein